MIYRERLFDMPLAEQEEKLRVMEDAGRSCRKTSTMKFKLAIRKLLNITLLIEMVDLFEISRLD